MMTTINEAHRRKCEAVSTVRKIYPSESKLEAYYEACLKHRGAAAVAALRADVAKEWKLRSAESEVQFLIRVFYPDSAMIRVHLSWCEENRGAYAADKLREELRVAWIEESKRRAKMTEKLAA